MPPATTRLTGAPAGVGFGDRLVRNSAGPVIVMLAELEAGPFAPLRTATDAVPGEGTASAGTAAVNDVELTKVVGTDVVFPKRVNCTVEAGTKLVPVTVNEIDWPDGEVVGLTLVIAGAVVTNEGAVPVTAWVAITTGKVPTLVIADAGITAVACVALTNDPT